MSDFCRSDYVHFCRLARGHEVGRSDKEANRMEVDCKGVVRLHLSVSDSKFSIIEVTHALSFHESHGNLK